MSRSIGDILRSIMGCDWVTLYEQHVVTDNEIAELTEVTPEASLPTSAMMNIAQFLSQVLARGL